MTANEGSIRGVDFGQQFLTVLFHVRLASLHREALVHEGPEGKLVIVRLGLTRLRKSNSLLANHG